MFDKITSAEWRIEYRDSYRFRIPARKKKTWALFDQLESLFFFANVLNIARSLGGIILEIIPLDFIVKYARS